MLAVPLLVSFAGCGLFHSGPSSQDVAGTFLKDFGGGDTAGAAALTDDSAAAKTMLDKVRSALKPAGADLHPDLTADGVDRSGDSVDEPFQASWDLGQGRTWSYTGHVAVKRIDGDWKVHWQPSDIHPKLAAEQTIALQVEQPDPAPVLDRDGVALLAPTPVITVVVDRKQAGDLGAVAGSLADALSRFDATITPQSIIDGATKTPDGQGYPVISLRDSDYQQVRAQIHELPGVSFASQTQLLAKDKALGPQLLATVKAAVQAKVAGSAGWRVITQDAGGNEVNELTAKPAKPAGSTSVTLSTAVQAAAQAAIASAPQAAAIVAMQPSTGELLAVAQNAPADTQGLIALSGQFPPGSTFKIVTAAATLAAGKATIDSPQACPGTVTIEGRLIPNEDKFDLGTVPLRTAFAQSCNTTFSQLAVNLPNDALTTMAKQLGVGADFTVPGVTTVTGSVPAATGTIERAEDGFGQGKDQVSPFGMALAVSTVVKGTIPTPSLLRGTQTKVNTPSQRPVSPAVLDSLRQMMRAVVTDGTARAIRDTPDVAGKTGTAQFGDGTQSHGWFVGYRGDLAFAVLLTAAGSSTPAVTAAGTFLRALR